MDTILKKLRLSRGLTQAQVYEPAGIAKSYYSLIENGKRQLNERLIHRIAPILDVPPYLLVMSAESDADTNFLEDMIHLSATQRKIVQDLAASLAAENRQEP